MLACSVYAIAYWYNNLTNHVMMMIVNICHNLICSAMSVNRRPTLTRSSRRTSTGWDSTRTRHETSMTPSRSCSKCQKSRISTHQLRALKYFFIRNTSSPADKHPEKRMKAAYEEFESVRLPELKAENPNLRLSQLKQMLRKEWLKHPNNPLNARRWTEGSRCDITWKGKCLSVYLDSRKWTRQMWIPAKRWTLTK